MPVDSFLSVGLRGTCHAPSTSPDWGRGPRGRWLHTAAPWLFLRPPLLFASCCSFCILSHLHYAASADAVADLDAADILARSELPIARARTPRVAEDDTDAPRTQTLASQVQGPLVTYSMATIKIRSQRTSTALQHRHIDRMGTLKQHTCG